jgi:nucleoside phosphorylase
MSSEAVYNYRSGGDRPPIQTVNWPSQWAPTPMTPASSAPISDLSAYAGYSVVITWTEAEAGALAALFTPKVLFSNWIQFQINSSTFAYLYPLTINGVKVLAMKSQMHLDYQGPTGIMTLFEKIAKSINPPNLITTGTAGGIGAEVKLGDVVIADRVRFHCTGKYSKQPWAKLSFPTAPLPAGVPAAFSPTLTAPNALEVQAMPTLWTGTGSTIVTTDTFAFDDSTDHYKLQGLGRVCEMDDAMVAYALQQSGYTNHFFAIRNASDPQIPNPTNDIKAASTLAARIYSYNGMYTTAASVIASWAVLACSFGYKPA